MTTFPVYSVDKVRETKVQLGTLVERRRTDRGNNIAGLLKHVGLAEDPVRYRDHSKNLSYAITSLTRGE